jgi:hypothetical protein
VRERWRPIAICWCVGGCEGHRLDVLGYRKWVGRWVLRSSGVEYIPLLDKSDCFFFCGPVKDLRIEYMIREAVFVRKDVGGSGLLCSEGGVAFMGCE